MTGKPEEPCNATEKLDRRKFLGIAAAGAGVMYMQPRLVFGTEANSAVRVGLLGCGGRGTEDASNLVDAGARVVALADLFQDQLDAARNHFDQLQQAKGYAALDSSQLFVGPKAFEQAAGFLRIREGKNPLDASAIHPESYAVAQAVLKRAGLKADTAPTERATALTKLQREQSLAQLAAELDTGVPTLTDIFEQLLRPGRDPREDLPLPILRNDVLSVDDLAAGMTLSGTVRNVVDFGAFVDTGVKQDGLLHRSQIPRDLTLSVGDIVQVEILTIEKERGRIGLGWKNS